MSSAPAATRTCTFCQHEIADGAAKCAACQEWTEDVKSARNWAWVWSLSSVLPLALFWLLLNLRLIDAKQALPGFAIAGAFLLVAGALCIKNCIYYSRRTGNWFWV